jgi:hypothetical protein
MERASEIANQLDMEGQQRSVHPTVVRELMKEKNIEVLGVLYALIMQQSRRINPPLEFEEIFDFVVSYYRRCFKEKPPKVGWASTNYSAGWDLVNWFSVLFADKSVPRAYLLKLKDWMAELYKTGDDELRACLVNATLEHLFEQKKIRKFFEDWKNDPILSVAHAEALEWVTRGGATPLGKPNWLKKVSQKS